MSHVAPAHTREEQPAQQSARRSSVLSLFSQVQPEEMTTSALLSVVFATVGAAFWTPWHKALLTAACLTWLGLSFSIIWEGLRSGSGGIIFRGVISLILCGYVYYVPNQDLLRQNVSAVTAVLGLYFFGLCASVAKALMLKED